jgi:LEA14-like dessication related protein
MPKLKITKNIYLTILLLVIVLIVGLFNFCCLSNSGTIKKIDNFEFKSYDKDTLTMTLDAFIEGSGLISYKIKSVGFDLLLENEIIGNGQSNNESSEENSLSKIPITLKVPSDKISKLLSSDTDSTNIFIKGKAYVKILFFDTDVNIEQSLKLNFDSLLSNLYHNSAAGDMITVEDGTIKGLSLHKSNIQITIKIKNPAIFPLIVTDYPAKVYINGKNVGELKLLNKINLLPGVPDAEGELESELDNFESITSLLPSIFSNHINYKTNGFLLLEVFGKQLRVPYTMEGELKVL